MDTDIKSRKIDMTEGPIMRNILLFAIPMVIGNILQQLYTTVDTLVLGNFCGHTSLAAMGTSAQPVEVLLSIFLGIGGGASVITSQHIGAGDRRRIKDTCKTAVTIVYTVGIPLGVLGCILAPFILKFMGTPSDVWDEAMIYTRIVFLGTLGNIGYNMNAGILRGMGDSKASLWFLVISCITNIILDLLFVAVFSMGIAGAAIATIISMYLSWTVSIYYIRKKDPELEYSGLPRGIEKTELKGILSLGIPLGINNSLFSFGHMALQIMINSQGSVFMAAASVSSRVYNMANMAITGISSAASTFSGQNYGAGRMDRLKEGHIKIPIMSGLITLAFGILVVGFRMPILRLFQRDEEVLFYASRFVVVMLMSYWMYAIYNAIANIINGTGKVKYTLITNLLMLWAVRIPAAYVITHFFDGTYLMLSYPASFLFGMIAMILYYIFAKEWKTLRAARG